MSENNGTSKTPTTPPVLEWLEDSIPLSTRFDDPYYSKHDGLSESRHVFVRGNNLPERFSQCQKFFTIAELGFGTGLNFLATLMEWQKHARPDMKLDFVSFEKYPLSPDHMHKALSAWPELAGPAASLVSLYDAALSGGGKQLAIEVSSTCRLSIRIGDAEGELADSNLVSDAWYLDGFSPAKNPDLWSLELLEEVYRHTRPGGTFATYTAAGWVRRNLIAAGFCVERVPGHAGKREMMVGTKPA